MGKCLRVHAYALIVDRHEDISTGGDIAIGNCFRPTMHSACRYFDFPAAGHRITRVHYEVQHRRLKLRWIDTDRIDCRIEFEVQTDGSPRGTLRELFEVEKQTIGFKV